MPTRTGITALEFAGHTNTPLLLSAGDGCEISCWQTRGTEKTPIVPKRVTALHGHQAAVTTLCVCRHGSSGTSSGSGTDPSSSPLAVSGGRDATLKLWDLAASARAVSTWSGHAGAPRQVRWSTVSRDLVVSAGTDGLFLVWDPRAKGKPVAGAAFDAPLTCADTHPASVFECIVGDENGAVQSIDLRSLTRDAKAKSSGKHPAVFQSSGQSGILSARYSPDGKTVAISTEDGKVWLTPCATGAAPRVVETYNDFPTALLWIASMDAETDRARLVSASWDKTVRVQEFSSANR